MEWWIGGMDSVEYRFECQEMDREWDNKKGKGKKGAGTLI